MQPNQVDLMNYHQMIQMAPHHHQPIFTNQNIIPQLIPYQVNSFNQINQDQEQLIKQQPANDLENINLENLANLVYQKLKVKKKHETSKINNNDTSKCSLSNKNNSSPNSSGKQDYDDYLIDFIIEQNETFRSTKSNDKSKFSNKSSTNFKCTNTPNKIFNTDVESDKLIEELFFLK